MQLDYILVSFAAFFELYYQMWCCRCLQLLGADRAITGAVEAENMWPFRHAGSLWWAAYRSIYIYIYIHIIQVQTMENIIIE